MGHRIVNPLTQDDSSEAIARDVSAVARISAVPTLLRILCEHTGMGFAAVARVTEGTWTACAVQDNIQFGLRPGGQLEVGTTLCRESRAERRPIVIDHASLDPVYAKHHTPRIYNIESYVSVPIVLRNDVYFGNLCAIDPRPANVSEPRTVAMFTAYAELIARQLESEELWAATDVALEAERAKADLREQFVAILGHDLRNPLAAVSAMAEVLVRRDAEPKAAAIGARIRTATRRMSQLIDDVLDFTRGKLGSGIGVELRVTDDLDADLRSVVSELREANPARELHESFAIEGPVRCDPARVQQLLSNLLGNALTHGAPDRPIQVEAATEAGVLTIAVTNQGRPISAESLLHVFEPFWRAKAGAAEGLGLGLHICSQIVRAHGGTLDVSSSDEQGTRFIARIPIAAAA